MTRHDDAQFLVFHFAYMNLEPSTVITITNQQHDDSSSEPEQQIYDLQSMGSLHHDFFTPPMYATHVIIEYTTTKTDHHTAASYPDCYGFRIDEYRFAALESLSVLSGDADDNENDSRCTSADDKSQEAACFKLTDSAIFERSNPVVRLVIQKETGAMFCTGWLFGCEGHILTNNHCVSQQSEADDMTVEFLAQGETCSESCDLANACRGASEAVDAQIVAFSPETQLDFALLLPKLSSERLQSLVQRYGFLSMRASKAQVDERIFIPQHPGGGGKRIAVKEETNYGRVLSSSQGNACNQRSDNLAYLLSTKGGSSGAPVIATSDFSVVGLHYCDGCHKTAIPASEIVRTLQSQNALPKCAVSEMQWAP
uniref:Serine protease n=1 Tax=Globisporangium ultimum (strain ATCC 200006 / CBS 805.95 / DAOM BR144) TaxID=431595 RepID=K3WUN0_GLOUD